MNRATALLALLPLLVAAQCNTPPSPPPPSPGAAGAAPQPPPAPPTPTETPDAGPPPPEPDTTPGVRLACDALAKAGCSEGGLLCKRVLQHAIDAQLTTIPLDCYAAAKTKADVRACGAFVACL